MKANKYDVAYLKIALEWSKLSYCKRKNCKDATLYITLSPCKECSKLIIQSGIIRVVYYYSYSDTSGLEFLEQNGVEVVQINPFEDNE